MNKNLFLTCPSWVVFKLKINVFRDPNDPHFDVNDDDGPFLDHRGHGRTFYHGGPGGVNCASAIEDHGPSLLFCPAVFPYNGKKTKKQL